MFNGIFEIMFNEYIHDLGNIYYKAREIAPFCNNLVKMPIFNWNTSEIFVLFKEVIVKEDSLFLKFSFFKTLNSFSFLINEKPLLKVKLSTVSKKEKTISDFSIFIILFDNLCIIYKNH